MRTGPIIRVVVLGWIGISSLWANQVIPTPPKSSGGPGEDPLGCASAFCHTSSKTGGPVNVSGGGVSVSFSSGTTYTPGTPVTVTVTVTDLTNKLYGFQMSARLSSNGQAGSFTPTSNTLILCDNGQERSGASCSASAPVEFIEHRLASSSAWSFTWTPPATSSGTIRFFVAAVAANNNGAADGGDRTYVASYSLFPPCTSTSRPVIASVNSATDFGGGNVFSSGSWLEIKGSNFASLTRTWLAADFRGALAPTALEDVSVSIAGKPAYVAYISPTQVNVQAPADTSLANVSVTVSNCAGASTPFTLLKIALAPGILAPASFDIGGVQYAVAQLPDGAFVGRPNLIAGASFRPAKPGDVVVLYGVGFGDVSPPTDPGTIASGETSLNSSLSVRFGSTPANVPYRGLSPGFVGLYQFNVEVPDVPNGDAQVSVSLNSTPLLQRSFFLTVQR